MSNRADHDITLPIIVDHTIALKLLKPQDASRLFALVDKNRHYLRQWLPWVDAAQQLAAQEAFIQTAKRQWEAREALILGIWHQQHLVGVISFNAFDWQKGTSTIGYWLDETQQGQGIVTKACQALIEVAFQQLGLASVAIYCATTNHKSQKIPLRLGFVWQKTIKHKEWAYDRAVAHHIYLLKRA